MSLCGLTLIRSRFGTITPYGRDTVPARQMKLSHVRSIAYQRQRVRTALPRKLDIRQICGDIGYHPQNSVITQQNIAAVFPRFWLAFTT